MKLSAQELAILNHVVPDGQAWADNAAKELGVEVVAAKIAKHRPAYFALKDSVGYKNRKQRDDAESAMKAAK